jgi:hypothetical protein
VNAIFFHAIKMKVETVFMYRLYVRILCRHCLLKHVIEGKLEGKRRQGDRRKRLLDDFKP